jgi:hypothetical protein
MHTYLAVVPEAGSLNNIGGSEAMMFRVAVLLLSLLLLLRFFVFDADGNERVGNPAPPLLWL